MWQTVLAKKVYKEALAERFEPWKKVKEYETSDKGMVVDGN